jgi:cold shock CspA family protein
MATEQEKVTNSCASEHLIGRVKWFNNKAGYGFITVTDGERSGMDVFVHHSSISVDNQYKYLVQGEYVEFELVRTESDNHKWQSSSVSGIKGGKLMCQTRRENQLARNEHKARYQKEDDTNEQDRMPRQRRPVQRKPRRNNNEDKEQKKVESKK